MKITLRSSLLWLFFLSMGFVLMGCSKDKEQAQIALKDAETKIAEAQSAGAGRYAPKILNEANAKLTTAGMNMGIGNYAAAGKNAREAVDLAAGAAREAENRQLQKTRP